VSKLTRIFAVLLISVVLFSLIAGCNAKVDDTNATDTTSTTSDKDTTTEDKTTTEEKTADEQKASIPVINNGQPMKLRVEFASLNPTIDEVPTLEQPDVRVAPREVAREFMKLHPNVEVEFVYKTEGTAWYEWLATVAASNELPDICMIHAPTKNYHLILNDALETPNEYYPSAKRWRDMFPEYLWSSSYILDRVGNIGCIPLAVNPGPATGYYYNKEIFEKLNLEVPQSFEALLNVIKVCRDAGYWLHPYGEKVSINSWDFQFSIGPVLTQWLVENREIDYDKDGTVTYEEQLRFAYEGHTLLSKPENEYVLDFFRLYRRKVDLYPEGYASLDYGKLWNEGKIALREDGMWALPGERSNTARGYEFGLFPPPVITKESTKYCVEVETVVGPYMPDPIQYYTIVDPKVQNRSEAHAEAAIQFMKFCSVPENLDKIVLEQKGSVLPGVIGCKIPPELADWCQNRFPAVPKQPYFRAHFDTSDGPYVVVEMYATGMISEEEFIVRMDEECKKDILMEIDNFVKDGGDISGWKIGW